MSSVCVAHLVWAPLGIDPFDRFISSYRQNRGGLDHHLLIIFNGFTDRHELSAYRALLEGIAYTPLVLSRRAFDIQAYYTAARSVTDRYVCFLNSYSIPLDEDWLAKMHHCVVQDKVGIVGATGSYQSLYSSVKFSMHSLDGRYTPRRIAGECLRRWVLSRYRSYFDPFPNPHVRTNAFMLARDLMLGLEHGRLSTKMDTQKFESGKKGLTRQIMAMNLKALVVGRDGRAYEKESWFESQTFKSGEQSNLLIADNRTKQYADADCETRRLMTKVAWGKDEYNIATVLS